MFDAFTLERVDVGDVELRVRHGGDGPPVVLLHGHPRTHVIWHQVAPLLARTHTVVCPDLRGYGESSKPPSAPDHATYSKRAMARDVVALMDHLGHQRFAIVGHDRGAYVAQRLAADHPKAVTHVWILDGVPIGEALERCDAQFAAAWWHWFFLAQPDLPEKVINADPDGWYGHGHGHGHGDANARDRMGDEAWDDYQRAIHDPATVHAMCEDYRAGLGPDRAADDADRAAGRRITCPVLVIWGSRGDLVNLYDDVVAVWREWADDVEGHPIHCGHHLAEEAPTDLAAALLDFLTPSPDGIRGRPPASSGP